MEILIVILLFAAGFGIFILFLPASKGSIKRKTSARIDKAEIVEKWQNIESTFALSGPSNFKAAIMDADKLVDYVLIGLGISGNTMGERLKNAKKRFSNYNDYDNLWFAHKVRNNIAHEVSHELNSAEARRAMEYFKKALKVLGVL